MSKVKQRSSTNPENSANHATVGEMNGSRSESHNEVDESVLWSDVVQNKNVLEVDVSAKPKVSAIGFMPQKEQGNRVSNGQDSETGRQLGNDKIYDIVCIMDSNRKFLNFERTFPGLSVLLVPCGNTQRAGSILDKPHFKEPKNLIIHVGINDIETGLSPEGIANSLIGVAAKAVNKFPHSKISVSLITPRADELFAKVVETNKLISRAMVESVSLIYHGNLDNSCMFDKKHLNKRFGVPLLARNFQQAVLNRNGGNLTNFYNLGTQYRQYQPSGLGNTGLHGNIPESMQNGVMMQMLAEIRRMNRNLQNFLPCQSFPM